MPHPFLFRFHPLSGGTDVVQAAGVRVTHAERRRVKGTIGGIFTEVETCGFDHSKLNIRTQDTIGSYGRKDSMRQAVVPKTAAGVKTRLRRLRPQEAEVIAAIDAKIERLQAELAESRTARRVAVREAWTKAHVVRLSDLTVEPDRELASR